MLSIYVQHDELVPQLIMKLVSFQVAEIIERPAILAYRQGDGGKDKKRYEVSGGKCAF